MTSDHPAPIEPSASHSGGDTALLMRQLAAGHALPEWLPWFVFTVLLMNVFAFILLASNPVLVQDGWYFLKAFVIKAVDGHLVLQDFFAKRGAFDHAQPLRRVILYVTLERFNLDMRVQAVVGLAAAAGCLLITRSMMGWNEELPRGVRAWLWMGCCLVILSLNSRAVWGWPLMAGGYVSYLLLFALIALLWRALARGGASVPVFVVAALVYDLASDDKAILATIALLAALGWLAWRAPALRRAASTTGVWLVAALLVARIAYIYLTPAYPPATAAPLSDKLHHLAALFLQGGWWSWVLVPLGASLGNMETMSGIVGQRAQELQIVFGLGLLAGQVWFWVRAFRNRANAPTFAAIVLMLLFYAFCAGVVYARVTTFGNGYLHQPRYVFFYSMSLVALLLMMAGAMRKAPSPPRSSYALPLVILVLAGWQYRLADSSWGAMPYMSASFQRMATQIAAMAENPDVTPEHCAPELPPCQFTPEQRVQLIGFLKTHRLNVFSKAFQRATRLYPVAIPEH